MNTEYWKQLLIDWRALKKDGLTIPFIIGSQKFITAPHSYQTIENLISSIADNSDTEVYMTYCPIINEIILGLRDESKRNISGSFPSFRGGSQSKFFLTSFPLGLGNDIETISARLTEKFQPYIDSAYFSINDRQWGDFSFEEVRFIKTAFSRM